MSCDPSSLAVNTSTACTATVTADSGTPSGVVDWTTDGTGSFDNTECTLVDGSCTVNYTPIDCSAQSVTAAYQGSSESDEGEGDSVTSEEGDSEGDDFAPSTSDPFALTVTGCEGNPGTPSRFKPDNLIRRARKGTHWLG